ncbi:hypothetical protein ACFP81_08655 [Deinococcus lacus]|uniref:Peptidase S8/S53 domain-containing protein n=1 Tax=Deinococcus lacus TaxID=392561 RepID=A0ABW1YEW5_9DEIO
MTKIPHLPPLLAALFLSTAAAQSQTLILPKNVPPPLSAPTKSLPLSEVFTRTAQTPNCVGNAFEMPGQAWHTDLTGGGVSLSAEGLDARPPSFEGLYGFAPSKLDNRRTDSELLVVDRFTPAPMPVLSGGGSETLNVSHGALVEAHLRALLESAGFALKRTQPLTYGRGARTVTLTRLDLAEVYATKSLLSGSQTPSDALATALATRLSAESKAIRPRDLVLNMSFALVPCQAMTVYRQTRDTWARATTPQRYNFNTFLTDVARASRMSAADVQRELTRVPEDEPLRRVLRQYAEERRGRGASLIAVASSGNFGLNYPTAPGSFPDVISAGLHTWQGKEARDGGGAIWPDAADVNVAGEWFQLSGDQLRRFCTDGGTCLTPDILTGPERYTTFAYRGTSFAAPTVSLFLALQQSPANRCFGTGGTGYAPMSKGATREKRFDFAAAWAQCEG